MKIRSKLLTVQRPRVGGAVLLSPALTGLPHVPEVVLVEVTLGSFQTERGFVIASCNRTEEVQRP
jgi:hypothetical protein